MGPDDFRKLLDSKSDGGFLFLDEAHSLMTSDPKTGKAILTILLAAAENKRETLTVVMAGYKDEIETKIFTADQVSLY